MNKPTIYVACPFYNEIELLYLKLSEFAIQLKDYDWKIILVESNLTFTKIPKPYYYEENKDVFKEFEDHIINIKMNKFEGFESDISLENDFRQKGFFWEYLRTVNPEDILVFADLDEIPDFRTIFKYFDNDLTQIDKIYTFRLLLSYYFLNVISNTQDDRSTICKIKHYSGNIRYHREQIQRFYIPASGWHFSYLGGLEFIQNKFKTFGHNDMITPEIVNNLEYRMNNLLDPFGRNIQWRKIEIDNSFPEYLVKNIDKYKHLIKE